MLIPLLIVALPQWALLVVAACVLLTLCRFLVRWVARLIALAVVAALLLLLWPTLAAL